MQGVGLNPPCINNYSLRLIAEIGGKTDST